MWGYQWIRWWYVGISVDKGQVVCGDTKRISMDNGLLVCGDISG